jgi:arginase family enzyme
MPNGMSWEELRGALEPLAAAPAVAGASLACYNPEKDPGRSCGRALVEVLGDAFAA